MGIYYEFVGYGKYASQFDDDLLPYPRDWYERQVAHLNRK
ncbi:hypothetical protein B1M_09262 [Burkholderia sp. TJI49]|nr:hypothetical protein B1M_09262 [Burkholderia sp. TJI49]